MKKEHRKKTMRYLGLAKFYFKIESISNILNSPHQKKDEEIFSMLVKGMLNVDIINPTMGTLDSQLTLCRDVYSNAATPQVHTFCTWMEDNPNIRRHHFHMLILEKMAVDSSKNDMEIIIDTLRSMPHLVRLDWMACRRAFIECMEKVKELES